MTQAVLLDLGNVVLGVDFRRVFTHWAELAGVDEQRFYDRWEICQAYRAHETGDMAFEEYCGVLGERFEVDLPPGQWREGWNAIWTDPFHDVIELLPRVAERYHLCCFTNTNDTHAKSWRRRFPDCLASFATIYVSSEIGHRKPDTRAFEYVCGEMDTLPEHTLFLDDTLENVGGARAAGLCARHVRSEKEVVEALRVLL